MDLIKINDNRFIEKVGEQYKPMLESINEYLPTISKDTQNFNKTQSSYMDNVLTVSHSTPLRNVRQCLAEIQSAKMALEESGFNVRKKEIEIKMKKKKIEEVKCELEKELLEVEVMELENQLYNIEEAQKGAIRRFSGYVEQIKKIKEKYNLDNFTEEKFEEEEEAYHITKSFEQAIHAARSHGGIIDEGNHIYFYQIGINGGLAQNFITKFLMAESKIIGEGKIPHVNYQYDFLLEMVNVFKGCSAIVLERKGMSTSELSILK